MSSEPIIEELLPTDKEILPAEAVSLDPDPKKSAPEDVDDDEPLTIETEPLPPTPVLNNAFPDIPLITWTCPPNGDTLSPA